MIDADFWKLVRQKWIRTDDPAADEAGEETAFEEEDPFAFLFGEETPADPSENRKADAMAKASETSPFHGFENRWEDISPANSSAFSGQKEETAESLLSFFQEKGFSCVDRRSSAGGSLWVIGSREELSPVIREAERIFGNLGTCNFSERGAKATGHRPAWFFTSDK